MTAWIRIFDKTVGEIIETTHWQIANERIEERVTYGHVLEVKLVNKTEKED